MVRPRPFVPIDLGGFNLGTAPHIVTTMHLASSHALLASLATDLGRTGHAASRVLPGLLAALDQHTADLRDQFTDGTGCPTRAELAGYCAGLIRTAESSGWRRPEAAEVNWRHADWLVLRLVAACLLAT